MGSVFLSPFADVTKAAKPVGKELLEALCDNSAEGLFADACVSSRIIASFAVVVRVGGWWWVFIGNDTRGCADNLGSWTT